MITVLILYKGKGAKDFVKEMISSGLVSEIRTEKGNIRYEYFFPCEEEEAALLVDSWENQEALDCHHALPLMGKIAALREKYDLHMEVAKYQPIISGADEKYIRK